MSVTPIKPPFTEPVLTEEGYKVEVLPMLGEDSVNIVFNYGCLALSSKDAVQLAVDLLDRAASPEVLDIVKGVLSLEAGL